MTAPRLFVEGMLAAGGAVAFEAGQAHYLFHVLRRRTNDKVFLFNGRDGEWTGRLGHLDGRRGEAYVETLTRPQNTGCDVWLVFAPVKRARLDFIAQRATEMGVSCLQPVLTRRTTVSRVNFGRLRANAIEAAEQCHLLSVPVVREVVPLDRLLGLWEQVAPGRRIMFCDEGAEMADPVHRLRMAAWGVDRRTPWAVLIGPEGGFDDDERRRLRACEGVISLSLGPRVMRADTAAVAALALWQAALGDTAGP